MDYANDYANMIEIVTTDMAKITHKILMNKLLKEIDEGAVEYWINYNYLSKGIEEYAEWLDEDY